MGGLLVIAGGRFADGTATEEHGGESHDRDDGNLGVRWMLHPAKYTLQSGRSSLEADQDDRHFRSVSDPVAVFASNLRRIRRERDLTQERLAELANMDLSHVSRIDRGEMEPGIRSAVKLADALGVPIGELFAE